MTFKGVLLWFYGAFCLRASETLKNIFRKAQEPRSTDSEEERSTEAQSLCSLCDVVRDGFLVGRWGRWAMGMAPLTHLMEGWFSGRQVGKVGMATLTHMMEGWFSGRQVGNGHGSTHSPDGGMVLW